MGYKLIFVSKLNREDIESAVNDFFKTVDSDGYTTLYFVNQMSDEEIADEGIEVTKSLSKN